MPRNVTAIVLDSPATQQICHAKVHLLKVDGKEQMDGDLTYLLSKSLPSCRDTKELGEAMAREFKRFVADYHFPADSVEPLKVVGPNIAIPGNATKALRG